MDHTSENEIVATSTDVSDGLSGSQSVADDLTLVKRQIPTLVVHDELIRMAVASPIQLCRSPPGASCQHTTLPSNSAARASCR